MGKTQPDFRHMRHGHQGCFGKDESLTIGHETPSSGLRKTTNPRER
jgi:metallophosphoesterase superfamily enzyme